MSLPECFHLLVEKYADASLSAAERAELRGLLREHPACQAALVAVLTQQAAIREQVRPALSPSARLDLPVSRPRASSRRHRQPRPGWRILAAGLAAAALLMLAWSLGWGPAATPERARLSAAENATIDGRPAQAGDPLPAGASLHVASGGRATLLLPVGAVLALAADTRLHLEQDDGRTLRLEAGCVDAEVAHQTPGQPFRMATDAADAEVVGTRLRLRVDAGGTRLEVSEGRVRFTDHGTGGSVEVAAGSSAEARLASAAVPALAHGQMLSVGLVGRAGAAGLRLAGYAPGLETVAGDVLISSSRTLRNQHFTGKVTVSGGAVTFEFCSFEHVPEAASAQLVQYNEGREAGTVICNWCDFDPGLRGNQGQRFTCNAQFGERGLNPPTAGSAFTLYRCRLQGCRSGVGVYQYASSGSTLSECLIGPPTHDATAQSDGVEICGSDNLSILRSRIEADSVADQACLSILPIFGDGPSSNPVVIQDCYLNGGMVPVVATWRCPVQVAGRSSTSLKNLRFIGNHFGDASHWGRECNFDTMDVTGDPAYAQANPQVIYWAASNVWAPDGAGVANPATSPSGQIPAGLPHTPGGSVDARNFFAGDTWIWNGRMLP